MPKPIIRIRPSGGALVPVIIIFVALAISAALFFFVTRPKLASPVTPEESEPVAQDSVPVQPATVAGKTPAPVPGTPGKTEPPASPETSRPMTTPPNVAPAPQTFGFTQPADVADQLARSLAAGDMVTAARLIAGGDASQEAAALQVLENMKSLGYKTAAPDQVQMIGQVENCIRLSIPLAKADGAPGDARIQIDVLKDAKMGWKIGTLHLPKELGAAMAGSKTPAPTVNPNGGSPLSSAMTKPLIVVDSGGPDAINFASDFVKALVRLDYDTARKLVDEEKVAVVKLAGLCIVFEDGKYSLEESKPLLATVATEQTSWIIAKVKSGLRNEQTEFGLEMEKRSDGWRVVGLNLSKLLSDNAKSSVAVGVPYTPLVQNLKGGESIALYYEYDSAVLHPRAQAQLKIVASVLKSSPAKKLKITGHTDAMGSDTYNIALSQRRAIAVKQFFLDQGVPVAQVETVGFGKTIPLSPNLNPDGSDNPEGRSRNRRAEILLDF